MRGRPIGARRIRARQIGARQIGTRYIGARYIGASTGRMIAPLATALATFPDDAFRILAMHAGLDGIIPEFRADLTMDKLSYTWGAAIELDQKNWAIRGGYFLVPIVSNSNSYDTKAPEHGEYIAELELRYSLFSQPGKLRLMGWANIGNMGSYADALAMPVTTPNFPDLAQTRQVRTNYGFVANLE